MTEKNMWKISDNMFFYLFKLDYSTVVTNHFCDSYISNHWKVQPCLYFDEHTICTGNPGNCEIWKHCGQKCMLMIFIVQLTLEPAAPGAASVMAFVFAWHLVLGSWSSSINNWHCTFLNIVVFAAHGAASTCICIHRYKYIFS